MLTLFDNYTTDIDSLIYVRSIAVFVSNMMVHAGGLWP